MRVGFLGVGHVVHAASYASALTAMAGIEIAGVYDADEALGRSFGQQWRILGFYSSPDELLSLAGLQAVVVCGPTDQHAPLVLAAAAQGRHVLCEKPLATRLADAQAMVAACAQAGVQLHLAYTSRFYPMAQEAKRAIDSGEVGAVIAIRGGNRGCPPLPTHGSHPAWLLDADRAGGGALIDHSVHVTDLMRYLLGAEVDSVFAEAGTLLHPGLPVEDCALMLLRFGNGTVASVDPSWSIPANNPFHYDLYLHILGDRGLIRIDDTRQSIRVARDRSRGFHPRENERGAYLEPFGVNIDVALVEQFVHSIRHGRELPPCATGVDGLRSLEIALAAYQSARTGQVVTLAGEAGVRPGFPGA